MITFSAAKLPSAELHLKASRMESVLVNQCFSPVRSPPEWYSNQICFGGLQISLGSRIDARGEGCVSVCAR